MKPYKIKIDGTEETLLPLDGKQFTEEELRAHVGGTPMVICRKDMNVVVVNNDLYYDVTENFPINEKASKDIYPFMIEEDVLEWVLGDAIVCAPYEIPKEMTQVKE